MLKLDSKGFPDFKNISSFKLTFQDDNVTCNDARYLGSDSTTIVAVCWKESAGGQVSLWIQPILAKNFEPLEPTVKIIDQKSKNFTVTSRLSMIVLELLDVESTGAVKRYIGISNKFSNLGPDS